MFKSQSRGWNNNGSIKEHIKDESKQKRVRTTSQNRSRSSERNSSNQGTLIRTTQQPPTLPPTQIQSLQNPSVLSIRDISSSSSKSRLDNGLEIPSKGHPRTSSSTESRMESRIETIDQSKHRERLDSEKSHSIITTTSQPISSHQRELEIKFQKLTELMIQTLRVSLSFLFNLRIRPTRPTYAWHPLTHLRPDIKWNSKSRWMNQWKKNSINSKPNFDL